MLNINKANLTIKGAGSTTTNLVTTSAGAGYGVNITANGVTFKGFNIVPPSSLTGSNKNGYTIHASNTPNVINGLTLEDIIIDATSVANLQRTGVDIHGVDYAILNNITVKGCDWGNGVSLTGCTYPTLTNITTSGNAWGGIAVYVSTYLSPQRGSSNITFDFATNPNVEYFYIEDESGLYNTNITVNNWTYGMNNDYSVPNNYTAYIQGSKNDALAISAALKLKFANTLTYCWDPTLTNYWVGTGMKIQRAIDVASAGNTVNVLAGTYNERLTVTKSLSLLGADESTTILNGTGLSGTGRGILINNGVTGVNIKNLTVQNFAGASGNTDAGVYAIGGNHNLTLQHVTIKNNVGGSGFYANGPINNVLLDYVTSSGHTIGARGIVIWNGFKENITITNCEVFGNNCCGIELQDGTASGITMENNYVHNNGDNGMSAIGLTSGSGKNSISNNIISQNGRFGIEIKLPNGTGLASGDGSIVVSGNTVTGTTIADVRDMAGIAVFRRGLVVGNNNVDIPTGVQVLNNTVSGYTQSSTSDGFGIVIEGMNHTITGNTVTGCDVGIQQQAGNLPYTANTAIDGDQNNKSDLYFGRGNSPVVCGITMIGNTLSSNGVNTRNVGTFNGAGIVVNTNTGKSYCSIQSAIDAASVGNTITVAAGTYAEDIVVNKSLDIRGPNYGINPNTDSRVAEAIIVPATSNPDINTGGQIMYLENAASGTTINGFTIDGDNPLLTSGVLMYGADVDVLEAISAYHGLSNVTVSNNIVKNLNYAGIDFYNYYNSGNATTGNLIENNLFENILPNQFGAAVIIYNNCYTKIINNAIRDVRVGVQTGNFYKADPGNSRIIDNNLMNVSRIGIFHNLAYTNASEFTISNNIISPSTNGVSSEWDGILLASLSVPSSSLNNNITGSSIVPSQAYEIWNVKSNAPAYISGGTLSNVDYGIFANNFEGYNSNGGDGAHATVENIQINPKGTGTGIYLHDNPSSAHANVQVTVGNGVAIENCANAVVIENANAKLVDIGDNFNLDGISGDYFKLINNANDIDATNVNFNGKKGSAMNLVELYAVETKLTHQVDNSLLGLITISTTTDASISLNYNYASPIWIDNNSSNSNATVPSAGSAPSFVANDTDFNNNNSVSFAGGTNILTIPYNSDAARLNGNTAKSFFTYFRTSSNITARQVIFEAGGVNSGLNVYVYNGKLYMGAWSSSARRFFYQTVAPNTNYLVSVEYASNLVRVTVNGNVSTYLSFRGFTSETSDNGVGGSYNKTRYMDNQSPIGIYHTFTGKIAEILCYNANTKALRDDVIDYIDAKYGTNFKSKYYGKMVASNETVDNYSWDEGEVEYATELGLSVSHSEENLEVAYTTTESQPGKLSLYDLNGQVVKSIYNDVFRKGTNVFSVETTGITSGLYFVVVETNFGLESKKVLIVK